MELPKAQKTEFDYVIAILTKIMMNKLYKPNNELIGLDNQEIDSVLGYVISNEIR